MSQNTIAVAARVATFTKTKDGYRFDGFMPHDEAARAKGRVMLPMVKANLVADRAARLKGSRALDLSVGTLIPSSLFAAKDIAAVTFSTGAGVESLRQSHRARNKQYRTIARAFTAAAKDLF